MRRLQFLPAGGGGRGHGTVCIDNQFLFVYNRLAIRYKQAALCITHWSLNYKQACEGQRPFPPILEGAN